ncbi:MAG: CDP-alcohol phosphatidyltransferase family protein [Thermoplasmata archaeon]
MVLNGYRERLESLLNPFAGAFSRLSPNALSAISLIFAFGAMCVLVFVGNAIALLIAAICVMLNGLFDALDGKVAKMSGRATPRGDLVDHVIDRLADFFMLAGISLSAFADAKIGLVALGTVLIASYMGTQSQALGLKRDYGGILGRAERILLLIIFLLISYAVLILSPGSYVLIIDGISLSVLDLMLLLFTVLAVVTILQRFARAWRALGTS